MKARIIRNHLKACSKEELVQILLDLAKRNPAVEAGCGQAQSPRCPGWAIALLDTLPDKVMAQSRQLFSQVISERQAAGGNSLGSGTA
jgi:hypothetical protein